MNIEKWKSTITDRHLGCFGNYESSDIICRKHCALRIRCAVECDQLIRMELWEEYSNPDVYPLKSQ